MYNRTINIQTSNSSEPHSSEFNEFKKSRDVVLILSLQKELFINVTFNHCSNFLSCWSSNDKKIQPIRRPVNHVVNQRANWMSKHMKKFSQWLQVV